MSSSQTPPSKCSPSVSSIFSCPLDVYDLNGTVKAVVKPDLQPFATKENHVKDLKQSEEAGSMSGSQSGSLSGSVDDTDSTSDLEDLEEEDPNDGSDATDSEKEYGLTRKLPRLTHGTCDTPKKSHGSTARDGDTTTHQRNHHSVPTSSAHPPNPLLFMPLEEQHSTINTKMKEQDWWFSLKSKNSPLVTSAQPLFLSTSKSHSVLPKSAAQTSAHSVIKSMSSSVDNAQSMSSRGLQVDSVALKRLVSITNPSSQDQDSRVYSTSQSSSLSSPNRPFLSSPTKNKPASFFNSHTNGFPQDAPLALVTQPRNHMSSPLGSRSQFPMSINLSPKSKQAPNVSPYKVPHCSTARACSPHNLNGQNTPDKITVEDSDESLVDDNDIEDTSSSTSDSSSSLGVNSESSDDVKGSSETNSDGYMTYQKLQDNLFLKSSPSPSDFSLHKTSCPPLDSFGVTHNGVVSSAAVTLPVQRKRVTDEKALKVPLDFGWQRVTRVRSVAGRLQGEVCYYAPCGKKLRLYPDVLKYLLRNGITEISRDNFSFSTKIKLGEFYLAREGLEGVQWTPLSDEAIAPCIIAMDGRRQRKTQGQQTFTGVQPPLHLQDVADAKLLRKLEAQEIARQATQMKIMKKLEKQARAQAVKEAKRQRAILAAEEKRKKKEQLKILKQQEKIRRIQQIRLEKEVRAQQILEAKRKRKEEIANAKLLKAEKRSQEREMRRQHAILQKHQERERRQHLMLLKEAVARKKAEEKERLKQERKDEKLLNKERKLELRRLELQELKKPREDLCLTDHKPLPELLRIPGLVLSGRTFSDCLMVLQFVHRFGKVLSLNALSLSELQAGLLNMTDGVDKVQALLVDMVSSAVRDPSLSQTHKMKTALGELLANMKIDGDNVSEALRIYIENHCEPDSYMSSLALSLWTRDFRAHRPSEKVAILSYLVNELCRCKAVVSEIDKNIDNMASLRKEKWIVEGTLRKLRSTHAKKTGTKAAEGSQTCDHLAAMNKRKRKGGYSEADEDDDEESDDEEDEEAEEEEGKKAKKTEEEDDNIRSASVEELEKEIDRAAKQQTELRQKLLESSYSLRSMMLGQDRYKRCYWLLPECGGVFVEGMETELGHEDIPMEKRQRTGHEMPLTEEELNREPKTATNLNISVHKTLREPTNTQPDQSPPERTHFANPKYKINSWTSACVPLHHDSSVFVNQWIRHLPPPCNKPFVNTSLVPFSSSSQSFSALTTSNAHRPNEDIQQQLAQSGTHQGGEILCDLSSEVTSSSLPFLAGSSRPPTRDLASQHARANTHSVPLQTCCPSVSEPQPHTAPSDRPTTASSSSPAEEVARPQEHSSPTPVQEDLRNGWWWMSNVEELHHLSKALHCRGIRERALTKQIQKHMEYLARLYVLKVGAVIDVPRLQKQVYCKEMVDQWCVQEQALKWDISALKQVETLESRVISASLQVKDWAPPKLQSQWEDLVYREHKSSSSPAQPPYSPLDIAVSRLAELERNIERRREDEDAPWRRLWHKALSEVQSSAQLVLCIQQLQNNIHWDCAIVKVECQICHRGDNEESLLLCDGCDKGCHVYCHKPEITSVPEGDWFCSICSSKTGAGFVIQQSVQSLRTLRHPTQTSGGGKRASEVKPNGKPSVSGELIKEETASRSSSAPRKSIKEGKKRKADNGSPGAEAKREPPIAKKAKIWRDGGTDELDVCQQLLGELEAHQDAWPFLKPVNLKSVPGYKKVVKKPMDLSTIREKFTNKQYSRLESFMDDVNLVFDNCKRFNEDNSEIGKAGHVMRRFFDKRRIELLMWSKKTTD